MAQGSIDRIVSSRTGKVTWRARFSYEDEHGRQHRGKTFKTKREAQNWLTARQHELRSGDYFEPTAITLREVTEAWLERKRTAVRSSTWYNARQVWRHWIEPALGSREIASIKPSDIQSLYDHVVQSGRGYATVANIHKVLGQVFRSAQADSLVRTDVTQGRRKPRKPEKPLAYWTAEQAQIFLSATSADEWGALWHLLLATGIRIGEALALNWADLDVARRTLRIDKTMRLTYDGSYVIGDRAKTRASNRTIVLPASTVLILNGRRGLIERYRMQAAPVWASSDLIFPNPRNGAPMDPKYMRDIFRRACRRAGVPPVPIHGLRHTASTLMIDRGANPKAVQEQLGHASIMMTLDLYTHLTGSMRDAAANVMEQFLAGSERTPDEQNPAR